MSEYEAIRRQLEARYAEIESRLCRVSEDVRHAQQPLDADFEEQAIERENDEVLAALDSSLRKELAQIRLTLERMDRGEYGVCEVCGKKIPPQRLAALPHASRCVKCAERP